MTTRTLPSPDVFASCPLDGKILAYYAGTFQAVYVSLNPFIKPISIDRAEFSAWKLAKSFKDCDSLQTGAMVRNSTIVRAFFSCSH